MVDSVIGLPGTLVLSRVVVEHRVEVGRVPTQHRHTVEQTVWVRRLMHKAVTKSPVQVYIVHTDS